MPPATSSRSEAISALSLAQQGRGLLVHDLALGLALLALVLGVLLADGVDDDADDEIEHGERGHHDEEDPGVGMFDQDRLDHVVATKENFAVANWSGRATLAAD